MPTGTPEETAPGTAGAANARTTATVVREAADAAKAASDAAKTASDDASAAYMAAKSARTDATEAKKQADAAKAAHTAAQTAADAAMDAYEAAKAAIDGVMDDSTKDEADTARMTAETQAGMAATGKTTAMTQQTAAEGAQAKAEASAGTHVLGLLKAANDTGETDATTRADTIKDVADRMARAPVRNASENRVDTRASGAASVTATWNANTAADPDNTPPLKEVVMYPSVTVSGIVGDDVTSETRATRGAKDLNGDGDTSDPGEAAGTNNAKRIDGLEGLPGSYGFDITAGDRHIIVFTDIEQQKGAQAAVRLKDAVNLVNQPAVLSRVVLGQDQTVIGGDGNTVSYDHDDDKDTNALTGAVLNCGSTNPQDCSYQIVGGKLIALVGYKVTVSAAGGESGFILKAATEAKADDAYLTFGVWRDEGDGDGETTPEMGAFYITSVDEGSPRVNGDIDNVTGTATYRGAAMGLYTRGKAKEENRSVDYFHGNATLDAKFDTATENGTISGMIDGIMAGGEATGDVIMLRGPQGDGSAAPADTAINDEAAIDDSANFRGIVPILANVAGDSQST